jgi:hypothetical protein
VTAIRARQVAACGPAQCTSQDAERASGALVADSPAQAADLVPGADPA